MGVFCKNLEERNVNEEKISETLSLNGLCPIKSVQNDGCGPWVKCRLQTGERSQSREREQRRLIFYISFSNFMRYSILSLVTVLTVKNKLNDFGESRFRM